MTARRLWTHRDARRYLYGQSLSLLGDSAMWLACGIWVRVLTGSNAAAALTFLFFTAPAILAPVAGVLVDRAPRRPLLIWANLAGAAVLTPLLAVRGRDDVWIIYAVMLLYGLVHVLIAPAQSALLTALLPADLLPDANATLRTVQEGLRVLAPLAGAGLFTLTGGRAVAVLDMLTFVAAACFTMVLRAAETKTAGQTTKQDDRSRWIRRAVRPVTAGFGFLMTATTLRRLTLASAVATLALGLGDSATYAVIADGLHRSPEFVGVLQMVQGIGAVLGGLTAAMVIRRLGERRLAMAGLTVFAVSPGLLSIPALPTVLVGKLTAGLALPWIVIAIITLLQRLAPAHLQGRVYAAFEVSATGPQTAGLAVGAALIAGVGYRAILVVQALLLACSALLLLDLRGRLTEPTALPPLLDDPPLRSGRMPIQKAPG